MLEKEVLFFWIIYFDARLFSERDLSFKTLGTFQELRGVLHSARPPPQAHEPRDNIEEGGAQRLGGSRDEQFAVSPVPREINV